MFKSHRFIFISIFFLMICFNVQIIFAQGFEGQFIEAGDGAKGAFDSGLNPNSAIRTPNTTPTSIIPPSRDRESLESLTNAIAAKKKSIFRAGFTFGGRYGQYDKLPYTDVYLSPYMQIGPFFMAYDVPLRFDYNGGFVTRMWTVPAALISKIDVDLYYSKTNHVFKNIQASIYAADLLYQGHGRFLYDYNPNILAPYETFKSFKFNLDVSYFGINYILANIAKPDLMSVEVFIKPLNGLKGRRFDGYRDLKFYFVYGLELDPFESFTTGLYNFSPNKLAPSFSMIESGADIPIFYTKNKNFGFSLFGDFATIIPSTRNNITIRSGSGVSGGLEMEFIELLTLKVEISQAIGHW